LTSKPRDTLRLIGSLVLALAIAAVSGFAALVGTLWGFGLKCDDSCSSLPPWRNDPDAWQWNALGWIGLGAFACSLIFLVAVAAGRRTIASVALVSLGLLAAAFLVLFRDSGLTSHAGLGWAVIALAAVAGAVAIALRSPHKRHPPGH